MTPEETRDRLAAIIESAHSDCFGGPWSIADVCQAHADEALAAIRVAGWVDPEEAARWREQLNNARVDAEAFRQTLVESDRQRDALLRERAEAANLIMALRNDEDFDPSPIITEYDRVCAELSELRTDLLDIRGLLSPNGGERVVPFDLGDAVAPAVEYLICEVRALLRLREAAVAWRERLGTDRTGMYKGHVPTWYEHPLIEAVDALPGDGQDQGGSQARPEDSASQVWAFPPEPGEEVTAVVDRFGQRFERDAAYDPTGTEGQIWFGTLFTGDDEWAEVPDLHLFWEQLMRYHAPLTDATGLRSPPAPDDGELPRFQCAECHAERTVEYHRCEPRASQVTEADHGSSR